MAPALETVLRRGAVFLWHRYDRLDDPNLAGQTKAKFIVILSGSPQDDPVLYVLTTSEKPKHATLQFPDDLLTIPAGTYGFFPLATVLDASEAGTLDLDRGEFAALYSAGELRYVGALTDDHVEDTMNRIGSSRRVARRVKQVLLGR